MRLRFFVACMLSCTALVVLISCNRADAQRRDSISVRVFNGTGQQLPSAIPFDKNYARINYYLLGRGALTVGIERILGSRHAVCVDVGLTYRDFIYELAHNMSNFKNSTVKPGTYLDVAYKIYPSRYHNFDGGFYISPGVILRNYRISQDVGYYDGIVTRTQNVDVGYGMREAYLKFGYVTPGRFFDDLIVDYYVGFGYRQLRTDEYDTVDTGFGGAQKIVTKKNYSNGPSIYIGLKVGYAF